MASVGKVAAFAAMLRVLIFALPHWRDDYRPIVWVLAVITVVVGSVMAVVQTNVKRMLAFSSVSHAGFILIGVEAAAHHAGQAASGAVSRERDVARRLFVLRFVQPGLAGLMDGSVSSLAPLFAAAFATGSTLATFKVGLAASVGAGISMGFAEALSDDGKLSGRGAPWLRGAVCGVMTMLGGLGHTLPYLINDFHLATTIALVVVAIELAGIAWIRKRYMDTPLLSATFQVIVGGVLVFLAGWLIGAG